MHWKIYIIKLIKDICVDYLKLASKCSTTFYSNHSFFVKEITKKMIGSCSLIHGLYILSFSTAEFVSATSSSENYYTNKQVSNWHHYFWFCSVHSFLTLTTCTLNISTAPSSCSTSSHKHISFSVILLFLQKSSHPCTNTRPSLHVRSLPLFSICFALVCGKMWWYATISFLWTSCHNKNNECRQSSNSQHNTINKSKHYKLELLYLAVTTYQSHILCEAKA